jgi:hypothetical protein
VSQGGEISQLSLQNFHFPAALRFLNPFLKSFFRW